jgi:hypothetical protein
MEIQSRLSGLSASQLKQDILNPADNTGSVDHAGRKKSHKEMENK